jgi:hypothetical protein
MVYCTVGNISAGKAIVILVAVDYSDFLLFKDFDNTTLNRFGKLNKIYCKST